ncbi:hypothetical protein DNG35_11975 [Mesonia sp. K7]|nr:hypothetical protein DNG35_11975 [Mesonia sp. K7]
MDACLLISKEVGKLDKWLRALEAAKLFTHLFTATSLEEYMSSHFQTPDLICLYLHTSAQVDEKVRHCQVVYPQARLLLISPHQALAYPVVKMNLFNFMAFPISTEAIQRCLQSIKAMQPQKRYIGLRTYKDFKYIKLSDILFLKADNNTTEFYLQKQKKVCGFNTLKAYQKRLPEKFMRIHKSYMVNTAKVWRIHFGKKNCEVRGHNHPLPFSKTYTANVKTLHKQLEHASF